jgi:type IV secretion system protein VirB8
VKRETTEEVENYYAEAGSWAADREALWRKSRRLTLIAAAVAAFIAVAEAIAIVALTPLKTVVPYTLLVDRETGYVQALDPLKTETLAPTGALTRSFLVQYVIARESFVMDVLQQNYRKAVLWSDGDARSSYISQMQASNPASPLAAYPRRTVLDVQVKSVTLLDANTALVSFVTFRQDPGAQPRIDGSWIASLKFHYSGEPMTAEDRLVNPLGFHITRYHKDVEILREPTPMASTALPQPMLPQQALPEQASPQQQHGERRVGRGRQGPAPMPGTGNE